VNGRKINSRKRGSASTFERSNRLTRPFVSVTFAMTVDGKITTRNFTPVDFTSPEDKQHLFRQRALADAVLLGHSTLERDNVRLGISEDLRQERIKRGQTPAPIRVIVSNEGRVNSQLKIFQWELSRILIFSTKRMPQEVRTALRAKNATLHLSRTGKVDLNEMLRVLRRDYKVRRIACEGGPILFRSLLELGLVDELNLTIAPYLFGGAGAPTLTGLNNEFLPASVHCVMTKMRVVGDECFLTYKVRQRAKT
jgi:riboflavin-specific deaminase-like protein